MNYFIQGDAANAGKIKAAFERLGYEKGNVLHIGDYANERLFFFTENGKVRSTLKDCGIVNIIKTHPDYKELELPVEPKFKLGDWLYHNTYGVHPILVKDYSETQGYKVECISSTYYIQKCIVENEYHIWTIQDAKDGDVLVDEDTNTIGIFGETYGICWHSKIYCSNYNTISTVYHQGGSHEIKFTKPATKEQRDLLFAKMREAGYEWDAGKKELRKTIDEPAFKVGDWVVKKGGETFYGGNYAEQITLIENDGYLKCIWLSSGTWVRDNGIRLWTIADARDGDILSAKIDGDGYILIFKQIKDGWIETYGHYYITIDKFCAPTQMFCRNYQGRLYPATQEQYKTLFKKMHDDGYEWDFDKKELKKIPVKPKFKVRGWVVYNGASVWQVNEIDRNMPIPRYELTNNDGDKLSVPFTSEYNLKEWTIQDAKDGDVLYFNDNTIVVFKDLYNSTTFHSYCHIEDDLFEISEDEMPDWWESKGFTPATKEQRDLLFAKMKEVGYQWDVDKKELRKIRPHYDISNFHAGMPVLVRADNNCRWDYSVFSRITGNEDWQFAVCNGVSVAQCIPFDGNEKLLGTTDMPSGEYINW